MTRSLIDITDKDYSILKNLTSKYTNYFEFYAFGSRINGKSQKYSDIDIAYKKLSDRSITTLKNELEESSLSITVDLVDLDQIDYDFYQLIKSEMVSL